MGGRELFIKGKVALVTGASRGIGKTIALELAKKGAKVAVNYNTNRELAENVVSEIKKLGGEAKAYKADVSDYPQVKQMIKAILEDFGTIHILVNNAGVIAKTFSVIEITDEEWDTIINTNLKGAFNCIKAVAPVMIKNKWGKIINISSVAGKMGGTVGPAYAASKAGLIGLTFSVAQELLPHNITVNAIAPGPIETEMIAKLPEERKKKILSRVPMGRFGTPEEVAKTVIFLIENDYITGEVIDVNGGYYMD